MFTNYLYDAPLSCWVTINGEDFYSDIYHGMYDKQYDKQIFIDEIIRYFFLLDPDILREQLNNILHEEPEYIY